MPLFGQCSAANAHLPGGVRRRSGLISDNGTPDLVHRSRLDCHVGVLSPRGYELALTPATAIVTRRRPRNVPEPPRGCRRRPRFRYALTTKRHNGGMPGEEFGGPCEPAMAVRATLLGAFSISSGSHIAGPWPRPSAKRLCELVLVSRGEGLPATWLARRCSPTLARTRRAERS